MTLSKENEHLISRYDDPDLNAAEREQLADLLETRDGARQLEAQYRRLDAELERLPDGLDSVDFTDFRLRIRESIEAAPVIRIRQHRLWNRWVPIAAAAAIAIACVSIWQALNTETKIAPPAPGCLERRNSALSCGRLRRGPRNPSSADVLFVR